MRRGSELLTWIGVCVGAGVLLGCLDTSDRGGPLPDAGPTMADPGGDGGTDPGGDGGGAGDASYSYDLGPPGPPGTLGGCPLFPANNPWNQDVTALPRHPQSDAIIANIVA